MISMTIALFGCPNPPIFSCLERMDSPLGGRSVRA